MSIEINLYERLISKQFNMLCEPTRTVWDGYFGQDQHAFKEPSREAALRKVKAAIINRGKGIPVRTHRLQAK